MITPLVQTTLSASFNLQKCWACGNFLMHRGVWLISHHAVQASCLRMLRQQEKQLRSIRRRPPQDLCSLFGSHMHPKLRRQSNSSISVLSLMLGVSGGILDGKPQIYVLADKVTEVLCSPLPIQRTEASTRWWVPMTPQICMRTWMIWIIKLKS